jgi:hypothetical protein
MMEGLAVDGACAADAVALITSCGNKNKAANV